MVGIWIIIKFLIILFFNCNFISQKSKLHIPYSHHFLCVKHYREPILKNIQKNHW